MGMSHTDVFRTNARPRDCFERSSGLPLRVDVLMLTGRYSQYNRYDAIRYSHNAFSFSK